MTTVVHIDSPSDWDRRLPWALRVAAAGDDDVLLSLPGAQGTRAVALQRGQGGLGERVATATTRRHVPSSSGNSTTPS